MLVDDSPDAQAHDDRQLLPSLAVRLGLGLRSLLVAFSAYTAFNVFVGPGQPVSVVVLQVTRMAILAASLVALRQSLSLQSTRVLGVLILGAVTTSVTVGGILRNDPISTALVNIAIVLTTAAFLPWGIAAQTGLAGIVAFATILSVYFGDTAIFTASNPPSITFAICLATSVLIARDAANSRRLLEQRLRETARVDRASRRSHALVAAVHQAELHFIAERNSSEIFDEMLQTLLKLTESEYGFIGEVRDAPDGHRYLRTMAISDIAWDTTTRELYDAQAPNLEFHRLDNLFGQVIQTAQPVISNHPKSDRRSSGLPGGHPPLKSFLGLPLMVGRELVGMVGVANKTEDYDKELVEYLQPFLTSCAQMTKAWRTERRRQEAESEVRRMNVGLEEAVRVRTTDLEEANRELTRFSASVSHDLRAPVRAIASFSQLLVDDMGDALTGPARDYLLRIHNAGLHMGRLIDDLLALARVSRGDLIAEEVELAEIARSVIDELQARDPSRHIEFKVDAPMHVYGDAGLLRILLQNLLGNAWKFTARKEPAVLELGCSQTADEHVLYIRDNGVGFDMRFVDKLFRMFERLHQHDGFDGTGIGLATVDSIVRRHKGRVWAEGAVDQGATFWFTLPKK